MPKVSFHEHIKDRKIAFLYNAIDPDRCESIFRLAMTRLFDSIFKD
jgi:hypothetical protein